MVMNLTNLDALTRNYMRTEAEADIAADRLYVSDRLSPGGAAEWPDLLLEAIEAGDAGTFAGLLNRNGRLNTHETYVRKGVLRTKRVPYTAAETLAEGEFNRFYIRGVCARAIADSIDEVEVYRAKLVMHPRSESLARVGLRLAPTALLADLRVHTHVDTVLGVPAGPNSGLSVRLIANGSPQDRGAAPGSFPEG
jgi:hypothetical protein